MKRYTLQPCARRWRFAVMPFQWIWRGCFDWHAAWVCVCLVFGKREVSP